MRKGALINVRTPRGTVKRGRFIQEVDTPNGKWLEVQPVDEKNRAVSDAQPFRCRPVCATLA